MMGRTKHQSQSYRMKDGLMYRGYKDVCEPDELDGTLQDAARRLVTELKSQGMSAFYESHSEGYVRVFAYDPKKQPKEGT